MNQKVDILEAGRAFSLSWRVRLIILAAALLGLGVLVYPQTLRGLLTSVLHREGSSHGLFVPFISGYFIWLERNRIKQCELSFSLLPGGAMVLAGLLLLYVPQGSREIALPALSFFLVVAGLVIGLFGKELLKAVGFPLLFLLTMIPLPKPIYAHIGEWMRAATTEGSVWLMQLIHFPIFREDYNVHLPNANLFIAMGCSGIRYLLSYFVFSFAYGFLFKKSTKSRILVVLASFPIALIAGVLRLSSIYLTVYYIGAFMAGSRPHILVSWSVFGAMLVLAIGLDQYVSGIRGQRSAAFAKASARQRGQRTEDS